MTGINERNNGGLNIKQPEQLNSDLKQTSRPTFWQRSGKPVVAAVVVIALLIIIVMATGDDGKNAATPDDTVNEVTVEVNCDDDTATAVTVGSGDHKPDKPADNTPDEPKMSAKQILLAELKLCDNMEDVLFLINGSNEVKARGTIEECDDAASVYWIILSDEEIVAILTPVINGHRTDILTDKKDSFENYQSGYNAFWFKLIDK